MGREIMKRLRFSNDEMEQVIALIENHMRFAAVTRMRESTVKRFLWLPGVEEHLELHRLDCMSSHGSLENYDFMRREMEDFAPEQVRPPRPFTGADLIAAWYRPRPQ